MGYHGRASSVVVSGTDVRRPRGQVVRGAGQLQAPAFEPSAALDFELEVVSGGAGEVGLQSVSVSCWHHEEVEARHRAAAAAMPLHTTKRWSRAL